MLQAFGVLAAAAGGFILVVAVASPVATIDLIVGKADYDPGTRSSPVDRIRVGVAGFIVLALGVATMQW
jgi:hypothetical protein